MIDQPSLAILIDCWDAPNKTLPQNIISFLNSMDSIQTVVLASYNCRKERETSDSLWYQNYNKLFQNIRARKIDDLGSTHTEFDKRDVFPNENTEPAILNYINSNKFQIAMRWRWELDYYLELNPKIQNIYVLGMAWDMCVKVRPLGYESLREIQNINVLTNVSCVLDMQGCNPIPNNSWRHLHNSIYHYE